MNKFYVYVLWSEKTGRYYTGQTNNLDRRVFQHNSGFEKSTKHGAPWKLVYFEVLESRTEAIKRERFLKTGKGRAWIIERRGSPPWRTKD